MVENLIEQLGPQLADRALRCAAIVAAYRAIVLMAARQAVIGAAARLAVDIDRNVPARVPRPYPRRKRAAAINRPALRFRRGFPLRSAGCRRPCRWRCARGR